MREEARGARTCVCRAQRCITWGVLSREGSRARGGDANGGTGARGNMFAPVGRGIGLVRPAREIVREEKGSSPAVEERVRRSAGEEERGRERRATVGNSAGNRGREEWRTRPRWSRGKEAKVRAGERERERSGIARIVRCDGERANGWAKRGGGRGGERERE